MSTLKSRQTKKQRKGNRRRTEDAGMCLLWGYGKDPYHSFSNEEALLL